MTTAAGGTATTAEHHAVADRVVARFRLRARGRAAWLRHLADRAAAAGGPDPVATELDAALIGADDPAAEAAWLDADPAMAELVAALAVIEAGLRGGDGRLQRLEAMFSLDPDESDLLQACFAVAIDPGLARVCAWLHDGGDRAWLTAPLIARLYGHGHRRAFAPESALRRWELVRAEVVGPAQPEALACDPLIRDWLLGEHALDEALVGTASLRRPAPPLDGWPVAEVVAAASRALDRGDTRLRIAVCGAPGTGRRTFAAAVAAGLGVPLLAIDVDRVDDAAWPTLFRRAHRQAFLDRCALAWSGDALTRRPWPDVPVAFPMQFLAIEPGQPRPAAPVVDVAIALPPVTLDERAGLWRRLVPAAAAWPEAEVTELAARYRVTVRELVELGRHEVESPQAAAALAREASRGGLGELATWLECPFAPEDLIVPEPLRQSLAELTFEARDRAAFWEQPAARRLFPQGRGLVALFAGASGTGKSMAAQVLASRLGLDLFRISLSTVVSKYVGETSQNLQRVLTRAEHMDAVLLFDEADALFGKRTEIKDAHDRFANTDTNHLLIAIESYRGIAILTTNKRANVDSAFIRRLRYVLDFPRPEAAQRLSIWRRLVAELAGPAAADRLDPALRELAANVDATGAQIKYALLAAMFAARQEQADLDRRHLLRGLDRELAKDGRGLSEREREGARHAR